MKVKELLNSGSQKLKKVGIKTHQLDAEILLSHVLKKSREFLLANPHLDIDKNVQIKYSNLIKKRGDRFPIAYILNHKEFYGLDFYVNKSVLIPRPETETLVENVLNILKKNSKLSVLEIGTGSGCISISILKNIKNIKITATDISSPALKIAQKNAKFHKVENKIKFVKSNLFSNLKNKNFDIIIANLPYVDKKEIKNELKYEPKNALVGGKNSWNLIEKLLSQISSLESRSRYILLEIGSVQGKILKNLAKKYLPEYSIKILKDLAGKDRVLKLTLQLL